MIKKFFVIFCVIFTACFAVSAYSYAKSDQGLKYNEYGKSYGDVFDAVTSFGEPMSVNEPDLIYVMATNGKYGYVKKEDMYSCGPVSPDDTEWANRVFGSKGYYEIDVFESDGVTVIGKFRFDR